MRCARCWTSAYVHRQPCGMFTGMNALSHVHLAQQEPHQDTAMRRVRMRKRNVCECASARNATTSIKQMVY